MDPHHPDIARSLDSIGDLYSYYWEDKHGANFHERALLIRKRALGLEHPKVAISLLKAAQHYSNIGTHGKPEETKRFRIIREPLSIQKKVLGSDHPDLAKTLDELGSLCSNHNMKREAKEYYGRALLIREKTLPLEDLSLLGSLNLFANHYQNDDTNEPEPIYRRLLTVHENLLGSDHPDVAGILDQLASVSQSQGTSVEAEQFFERTLAIRDKALEPGHVDDFGGDVRESLLHLASLNLESGKEDKAEELLWRALVIHDQSPSPHEVRTTWTLQLLANLYHRQHRYAQAEPLYERLVTNWRSSRFIAKLPTAVPEGLAKLAEIYVNNGRLDDAERLYRQSLGIWERIIAPEEPVLITKSVDEGAISLFDINGRDAEPEPLADRALAALANATWPEHEQLVSTLEKFSDFLRDREHIGDSDRLGKEAKAIRNRYSEDPYSVEDSDSISKDFAFDNDEFGEDSFKLIVETLARITFQKRAVKI